MIITNISNYNNKMKQIEFKTSKGEFILVDLSSRGESGLKLLGIQTNELSLVSKLSEITEEQASEVVDEPIVGGFYPKYGEFEDGANKWYCLLTSIKSLHSLLKSKGIHLYENPVKHPDDIYRKRDDKNLFQRISMKKYQYSEQNTFYNPYLFKKI